MTTKPPIIALGYTWPDLAIEEEILGRHGYEMVDGRGLAADDALWPKAAGVLLGTADRVDAARLSSMPNCRGVVRYGIGYDNVDIAAAEEQGKIVAIVRDYCIDEVAEHALAFALSLARGLAHWDGDVRSGAWRRGERPRLRKLSSLNLGIIGFGLIGRALAEKARGLFGTVSIHDPYANVSEADRAAGYVFVLALGDLLREVDILSVHVPLTSGTKALIGAEELALMKPSASVINVSRGGVVDEAVLLDAVKARRLFGAALDTFVTEPLPADGPFVAETHVQLSPHVAWLSEEAEIKLRERASEELLLILSGERPSTPVTRKIVD